MYIEKNRLNKILIIASLLTMLVLSSCESQAVSQKQNDSITNEMEIEKSVITNNSLNSFNETLYNNIKLRVEYEELNNEKLKIIGRMIVIKDRALEIYFEYKSSLDYYTETINEFRDNVNDEVTIYTLVAPTQIEFINNKKINSYSSSQKKSIEYINSKLESTIKPIDAYSNIKQNAHKYVYFRTDHHWTALGAYHAYVGFTEEANIKSIPIEEYEVEKVEDFYGSTYQATKDKTVHSNPDTIDMYKPFTEHEFNVYYEGPLPMDILYMPNSEKQNKYSVFLSGDRPWYEIKTNIDNDKRILVIKDSYGNALIPFLLPHYEEIYAIDPRQFTGNVYEFIEEKEINEVLFVNYILGLQYTGYTDLIKKVMSN